MRNYVQEGDRLTLAAPYALTSGQGAQVGQIFGVTNSDAANGATTVLKTSGVFDLTKVGSQAWTAGALVYWDNTNRRCTTTATGALLIGAAVAAVANGAGDTIGRVRLNGTFRANEA
jgi:predicted RecA/RadA family phage recombinase